MKLLFVKGTAPLSKFITWGLDEPISHFAILFDEKIVFDSSLLGVGLHWYDTFLKTHEVVYQLDFSDANLDLEEEAYQSLISKYDGDSYDYRAFAYFTWRGFLKKVFKKPLPEKNPYGSDNSFICTELAKCLPDSIIPAEIKAKDLGMISPYQLWLMLQNRSK